MTNREFKHHKFSISDKVIIKGKTFDIQGILFDVKLIAIYANEKDVKNKTVSWIHCEDCDIRIVQPLDKIF